MPLVLADRVRDTTTTTGTGTVTLSGTAPTGYQSFAVIGNGNTTYYTINAGSQWEVGIGTYSSTGPTLARNTVLESSNSNALVDFAAGTKDVFVTYPADEAVYQDGATIAAGTAVLGVTNGGTGVTTSTGTSSVVLSNSPTLVTPTLGAASATSIAAALGSVGAPSYTFTGDLNTGIYSPAADTLAFVEGGVEAMRINSSADVGIGTTSPAGRLAVASATGNTGFNTGTSSSPERGNLWYDTDGTGWKFNIGKLQSGAFTAQMTFQDNGNVGIGTSSPAQRLDVLSSGDTPAVFRSAGANTYFQFVNSVASAGYIGYSGSALTFWTGSERMRITAAGDVGVGTSAPVNKLQSAYNVPVSVPATGTVGGHGFAVGGGGFGIAAGALNNGNGYLQVTHWDGTSANYNLLLQPNGGNVGIGTSTPAYKLDVNGAIGIPSGFSGGHYNMAYAGNVASRSWRIINDINAYGDFAIMQSTTQTGTTYASQLYINPTGNVGIGTSSPASRLDVVGGTDTLRVTNTDATAFSGVSFYDNAATRGQIWVGGSSYASFGGAGSINYSANSGPHVWYTNYSERMRIDSAGNVGIGTTAPATRLSLGTGIGAKLATYDSGGVLSGLGVDMSPSSPGYELSIFSGYSGGNGIITFGGYNTASSTFTERMRIDNAGNLLLGTTTNTGKKLTLAGSADLTMINTANTSGFDIGLLGGSADAGAYIYQRANSAMIFGTNNTERMRITAAGDVGIGTSSPTRRLSVAGTANAYMDFSASSFRRYTIGSESRGFILYDDTGSAYRMVVDGSGNVGIGTTAPNANLQIVSANTVVARLTTTGAATQAELSFGSVGGSALVSLDQSGNLVARTQQGSIFFDNFGAGGAINFRTGGANTRFSISNTGAITSSDLADAVGYKGLPPNAQGSGYTLVMADQGKMVTITGGVTIPANGSVAFPVGTSVVIYNNSASNQTISITTDTLRLAGTATTGARTLAQRGFATCIKVAATEWVVTGNVT